MPEPTKRELYSTLKGLRADLRQHKRAVRFFAKKADTAPLPYQILRLRALAGVLSIHPRTVQRWLQEREDFPKPRRIGAGVVGWLCSDVEQWVMSRPKKVRDDPRPAL